MTTRKLHDAAMAAKRFHDAALRKEGHWAHIAVGDTPRLVEANMQARLAELKQALAALEQD